MPGRLPAEARSRLHIGVGAPARIEVVAGDQRVLVRLANPEMTLVVAEREHPVEAAPVEDPLVAFDAEGIAGRIGELRIFLRAEPHLQVFLAGGESDGIARKRHHHHAGMGQGDGLAAGVGGRLFSVQKGWIFGSANGRNAFKAQ